MAAISRTTAVGARPCSHKKLMEERCVFWATKVTKAIISTDATTTAVHVALNRVGVA
jgi:hypothetical protein